MSDKLEALSQPVAYDYQIAGACIADGHNENGKWVHWRNELDRERPPEWMLEEGKVKDLKPRYSQEYVTALLTALKLEQEQSAYYERHMWNFHGLAESESQRAEASEQRLELVREQRDNELRTNSELELRLQQPIPGSLIAGVCMIASDIYYENDEDKAQDIINRIRDELLGFKVEGE